MKTAKMIVMLGLASASPAIGNDLTAATIDDGLTTTEFSFEAEGRRRDGLL